MLRQSEPKYEASRLEWTSDFAYSPAQVRLLASFAGVRPGARIVELGCGSGFWGRLLARGLRGRGSLLGVDLDRALLRRARFLAREAGLANVTYRFGDATRTRLRAASADVVTCHRLLCVVPDPEAVLREMVRVARPGGVVVANEHDFTGSVFWDPDDPALSALQARRNRAWARGFRKIHGGDHDIGGKLAAWFVAAGLRRIRLEGVLAPVGPLPFDDGVTPSRVRAYFTWLRDQLRAPDRQSARILAAGGWYVADERRLAARALATIERRLSARDGLRSWGRIALTARVVVCGIAP